MSVSAQKLADYIRNACVGFEHNPPDSEFQCGYFAALIETGKSMGLNLPWGQWRRCLSAAREAIKSQEDQTS